MERDQVIRMAREAGFSSAVGKHIGLDEDLERFFHAASDAGAAAESEACAKVCDELAEKGFVAEGCAAAIRARGKHDRV